MTSDLAVFHFTDSLALPDIIRDGVLHASRYDSDLLSLDPLLWATTDPSGDRTANVLASSARREAVRAGRSKLVRVTLPARGFITWQQLKRRRLRLARDQELNGFEIDIEDIHDEFANYEFDALLFGQTGGDEAWRIRPCNGFPIRQALRIEAWSAKGRWQPL